MNAELTIVYKNIYLSVAMVIELLEWREQVTQMSKEEVPDASTNRHTEEQPAVVGHGNKHENIAQAHLHYVQH